MPNLEEFEKKLYKKDADVKKQPSYETYKEDSTRTKEGWEEKMGTLEKPPSNIGAWIKAFFILILIAELSFAAYYYYPLLNTEKSFDTKNVKVEILGPEQIIVGDENTFTVTYKNDTQSALKDAEVVFEWPENSIPSGDNKESNLKMIAKMGTILPRQKKESNFKGRMYGAKDEEKEVKITYRYMPEDFNSFFDGSKSMKIKIESTPVLLHLESQSQVVSDKETELKLEYQNQSEAYLKNIVIKADYPIGFNFISAEPAPSTNNNVWNLGTMESKAQGVIKIKGSFTGIQGESKVIRFAIGASSKEDEFIEYAATNGNAIIASSALLAFQTVNGSRDFVANPGTTLRYKIRYKNTTNTQIPNVVILSKIDSTYVDLKTLNIQWGSYDDRSNSMIWNSRGLPELSALDPKEEGEVSFSVNVKPVFLPKSFSEKNLIVRAVTKITSATQSETIDNLPIENEDKIETKINTQLSFNTKGYYDDGIIQNTGLIPPKVGEKTTYTISWQLTNTTNDVENTEISATLPPNIEWMNNFEPKDAKITFDQTSGVIKWNIDKITAGTGILSPVMRIDFQVAFTPTFLDVGQIFNLISAATLHGTDTFTGTEIDKQASAINSDLLGALKDRGKVVQ